MSVIAYPAGVPATSRWLFHAMIDGYTGGLQLGVSAAGNPWPGSTETFSGRPFYLQTVLGTGKAPFNPTGRNQAGTLVETPCTQAVWDAEVNTPQAGGGGYPRTIDCSVTVLGIRSADKTWPGGAGGTGGTAAQGLAAINAWTLHDGSYVDTCVKAWANMMKTVSRATMVRLWHEQGNMLGGMTSSNANFISAWRKVFDAWVTLGAVYHADLSDLLGATPKCLVAWCPAAHPANPSSDVASFPGTSYVHVIGRDIYKNAPNTWGDSADLWYTEFEPSVGPSNAVGRPLMAFEGGNETTDPLRVSTITEWGQRLSGTSSQQHWDKISMFSWWSSASNNLIDTPAGFQAAWQAVVNGSHFMVDGLMLVQNGISNVNGGPMAFTGKIHSMTTSAAPDSAYDSARYDRDISLYQDGLLVSSAVVSVVGGSHTFGYTAPPGDTAIPATSGSITIAPGAHGLVVTYIEAHALANVTLLGKEHTMAWGGPPPIVIPHTTGTVSMVGGGHTSVVTIPLAHAKANVTMAGGSHPMAVGNNGYALGASGGSVSIAPGSHTFVTGNIVTTASVQTTITGGSHTMTTGRTHGEGRHGRSIRDLIQKVDY